MLILPPLSSIPLTKNPREPETWQSSNSTFTHETRFQSEHSAAVKNPPGLGHLRRAAWRTQSTGDVQLKPHSWKCWKQTAQRTLFTVNTSFCVWFIFPWDLGPRDSGGGSGQSNLLPEIELGPGGVDTHRSTHIHRNVWEVWELGHVPEQVRRRRHLWWWPGKVSLWNIISG